MNIENFSGDAQTFERGSNLYAQVSTELKGGFEEVKQNYSTATSFLPEVSLQDAGANFISSPGRLGGDERRKAAEQATKQQEAPGRKEAPAQRKADEELPQREAPRGSLNEAPAQKGNEGPTRKEDPAQKEQKGKEEPKRKEQQQGS